jgi:hypothetical protein
LAQVVQCQLCKLKALSSKPQCHPKKRNKEKQFEASPRKVSKTLPQKQNTGADGVAQ